LTRPQIKEEFSMLVLSRKAGEKIHIGNNITVTVIDVRGERVKLGFECPAEIPVHREEVAKRIRSQQTACRRAPLVAATFALVGLA
jgi:carbon storage regulator